MKTTMLSLSLATLFAGACWAADAKAGAAIFDKSCKSCHGADGTPNPAIAKMMKVEMKDLKTVDSSEGDIKKIVTEGKGKMKPIASVTGAAADNVAAYVHSLKK